MEIQNLKEKHHQGQLLKKETITVNINQKIAGLAPHPEEKCLLQLSHQH